MEEINYSKFPMSVLAYYLLTNSSGNSQNFYIEKEILAKLKKTDVSLDKFLEVESTALAGRDLSQGLPLSQGVITMQQLFEIYFNYSYGLEEDKKSLLLSERVLCGEFKLSNDFFSKVCDLEIHNIAKRIQSKEKLAIVNPDKILALYHDILRKNRFLIKHYGIEGKKERQQKLFDMYSSSLLKAEYQALKDQISFLMFQAKNFYLVDYESDEMKKTLGKVKDSLY